MSKEKNKIIEICAELLDKNNKNKLMNIIIDLEKKEHNPNSMNEKDIALIFYFCAMFLAGISITLGLCSNNKGFLLCLILVIILTGFGSYYNSKCYNKKNYKKIYTERNDKKEKAENWYIKIIYYLYMCSLYLILITEKIKNNEIIKKICSVLEEEITLKTFFEITLTLIIGILLPKEIEIFIKIVNMLGLIILIPIEVARKIMLKFIKSII